MYHPAETQRIISLCTGYGGLELGIERAGTPLQPVLFVERECYAAANLASKIEAGKMGAAPICTDVHQIPSHLFTGKVHGIIGGYPCQPFSAAGQRKGADDPRHLWPSIRRHAQAIRPLWMFFENVRGHLTLGFDQVYRDLQEDGYAVEFGLFSASEVGAPHGRCRLFILAHSDSLLRERRTGNGAESSRIGVDGEAVVSSSGRCKELADSDSVQPQHGNSILNDKKRRKEQRESAELGCYQRWPARRRLPQYKWEEPRTIEPQLVRTADGFKCWVDRTRMVGNGVVPATAALAWKTLWKQAMENTNEN